MKTALNKLSELPALQHINWRPDGRELKRFAVAMLAGFGILGGIFALRAGGFQGVPVVLWVIGVILATAAFIPVIGRFAYLAVYVFSGLVGAVVSRVILALMFLFVFVPLGIFLRLTGKDFLTRTPRTSMWRAVELQRDASSYYRQF